MAAGKRRPVAPRLDRRLQRSAADMHGQKARDEAVAGAGRVDDLDLP